MTLPPRGITATDITAIWGVPTGTVYWLAKRNDWRRYRWGRRVYYHPDDVTGTLDCRELPAEPRPSG